MPTIADIWLNNTPFMLEGNHEGLATSANPAAVGVGGGGEFKDYTQWSQLAMNSWALGVGFKDVTQGGTLYSETETRYANRIMLPPKLEVAKLDSQSDCRAYFAEDCGTVYMGYGNHIYQWNDPEWKDILTLDECVTGMAVFDEYLHIGQGADKPYHWYNLIDHNDGDGPHCADGFYSWGGFLYSWCCNSIKYTNGGHTTCDEFTPPPDTVYDPLNPAPGWQWTEISVGVCDTCECINGLSGVYLGALGQSRLYVSTPSQLYAILPGDVVMSIASWNGASIDNGRGMTTYNGAVYAPVKGGLLKVASDGSMIQIGINQGEALPCDVAGEHVTTIPTNYNLLSLVDGQDNTIWAWAEGWHYITKLPAKGAGGYYSAFHEQLFLPMANGTVGSLNLVDQHSPNNRYADIGLVDLGYVYGGLRLAVKDFHDIIIDGERITPETPVKVYWSSDIQDGCAASEKHLLGVATGNTSTLAWPCTGDGRPAAKQLRLWLELSTSDEKRTPIVRNVILRFLPNVVDQARWHYAIVLNKDCMLDACGSEIEGYDQRAWDCVIRKAIVGVQPVKFKDFDGAEYYVKVMDWARRIHNRDVVENDQLKFDISWSLTLVQACPESLIVC
jgi:hypothetical protein